MPITTPKAALRASCVRNSLLRRLGGIVERRGGLLQVVRAGEADQAVPQVLPLQQDEDHEDDDDPGRRSGWMSGVMKAPRVCRAPGSGWRTSTGMGFVSRGGHGARRQRVGRRSCPGLRLVEFLAQVLQHVGGALERAAAGGGPAQGLHLLAHGGLVARQVAGELGDLRRHDGGESRDAGKGNQDDTDDGQRPRHMQPSVTAG